MPSLDTNVLVRWLVEDAAELAARAGSLFEAVRVERSMLFIPATVMLELAGAAGFSDCLHAGLCCAAGRAPSLTFDEKAARAAAGRIAGALMGLGPDLPRDAAYIGAHNAATPAITPAWTIQGNQPSAGKGFCRVAGRTWGSGSGDLLNPACSTPPETRRGRRGAPASSLSCDVPPRRW
jgi:predicted nucleic acid-binding protein